MDTNICGLNKVICVDPTNTHDGETVTITNTVNTWTGVLADSVAVFIIPSVPAPAKKTYTVTLGTFSTTTELGFGDVTTVYLASGYGIARAKDIDELEDKIQDNTDTIADNVVDINTNTTDISALKGLLKLDGTGSDFQFAQSNGQYGYRVGGMSGTFHPFKTGAETFCYYLGTGNSFDIKAKCSSILASDMVVIDYTKLTNANFIAVAGSGTCSNYTTYSIMSVLGQCDVNSGGQFTAPGISYNASTGVLTVGNGTIAAQASVKHTYSDSSSNTLGKSVYMVKSI